MFRKRLFQGFIFVILVGLSDCSPPNCGCSPPPTNIEVGLSFLDESDNDLLNQNHQNALNKYTLDVNYLTSEGEEKSLAYGLEYEIRKRENENNYVDLSLGDRVFVDVNAKIIVNFPDSPTDTLEVYAEGTDYDVLYAEKIWYDNNLVWEKSISGSSEQKFFEITKKVEKNRSLF